MYTYAYLCVCLLIYVHDSMYICIQMCVHRATISTDIYWNLLFKYHPALPLAEKVPSL